MCSTCRRCALLSPRTGTAPAIMPRPQAARGNLGWSHPPAGDSAMPKEYGLRTHSYENAGVGDRRQVQKAVQARQLRIAELKRRDRGARVFIVRETCEMAATDVCLTTSNPLHGATALPIEWWMPPFRLARGAALSRATAMRQMMCWCRRGDQIRPPDSS